jgi:hypothetical protein
VTSPALLRLTGGQAGRRGEPPWVVQERCKPQSSSMRRPRLCYYPLLPISTERIALVRRLADEAVPEYISRPPTGPRPPEPERDGPPLCFVCAIAISRRSLCRAGMKGLVMTSTQPLEHVSFESPDEVREGDNWRLELLNLAGGAQVGRITVQPG